MIEYLFVFIMGVITGVISLNIFILIRAKKILKLIQDRSEILEKESIINVTFEKNGDHIYAYDVESGAFMAQGTTKEELVNILNERYPNKSVRANADNMKEVGLE